MPKELERQASIAERMAQVSNLAKQHGGVAKIPDEALGPLGYRRIEGGHIAPLGLDVTPIISWKEKKDVKYPIW